jgi:hypothetical protein
VSVSLTIENCMQCPHFTRGGGFASISYIPKCKKGARVLPYEIGSIRGITVATATGTIPEWCPLKQPERIPVYLDEL